MRRRRCSGKPQISTFSVPLKHWTTYEEELGPPSEVVVVWELLVDPLPSVDAPPTFAVGPVLSVVSVVARFAIVVAIDLYRY